MVDGSKVISSIREALDYTEKEKKRLNGRKKKLDDYEAELKRREAELDSELKGFYDELEGFNENNKKGFLDNFLS
ncbi:MAG: hypothetical protein ACQEP1_06435 [Nanobdellota archaeon]